MKLLLCALAGVSLGLAQSHDAFVAKSVAAMEARLVETRRDFHRHPELSNQEKRTGEVIAMRLRELGFEEVRTGVAGHGVVGVLKGAKPGAVVAWRADIDALPIDESDFAVPYKSTVKGVKHACGHDAHITVGLGLAEVLALRKAELKGTVKLIFQPAEEGVSDVADAGARLMVKEGVLENPRPAAIFAFHASPAVEVGKVAYAAGPLLASVDSVDIVIKGKRAHGAFPEDGVDAVVLAAQCINMLQTIHSRRINTVEPSVLSIGVIKGGDRHNVTAGEVRMEGTLRTFSESVREAYRTYVKQTLTGCTAMSGGTFSVEWKEPSYPATINPEALVKVSLPGLERILGKENVMSTGPQMGAEDFSYFQREIPGVMFWLGVRNEARGITSGLHTADFDIDEAALGVGVKAAANLVLDYLERHATSVSQ
ncbi:MAG: M20 family metallopeptidase [Bryobacter sp.]|nr:M20 family metallopeptidase [Bryobacter sp.]